MATTASASRKPRRLAWRLIRWSLLFVAPLLVALVIFALLRPLTLLIAATQARLWFEGIHSESMDIPFAGSNRVHIHYFEGGSGEPVVLVHGLGGRAED